MTLDFLSPGAADGVAARSPMEREARAAGATIERRDGWRVAVAYGDARRERERCRAAVGWADLSQLGKIELQASAVDLAEMVAEVAAGVQLEPGSAARAAGAWWCPLTRERALVLADPGATATLLERLAAAGGARSSSPGATAALPERLEAAGDVRVAGGAHARDGSLVSVVDASSAQAALALVGPQAREAVARFSAVDLRPRVMPVGGWRPVSVARTPGAVLREAEDRFLLLFGAALGSYLWTVVADAAGQLGGGPVGVDALDPIGEPAREASAGA